MQVNLEHYPQTGPPYETSTHLRFSYFDAFRPPVYSNNPNTTTSVTSGGTTVSITGFGFATNSLTNALIDIFDSSGNLIETQVIA